MSWFTARCPRGAALVSLSFLAALLSGCGVSRCDATGTVTYKGKPVVCGAITFFGSDGIPVTAAFRQDGSYEAHGVPVGMNVVTIYSLDPARPMDPRFGVQIGDSDVDAGAKPAAKKAPPAKPGDRKNWMNPEVDRSKWFPIPQKYERPDFSGLSRELKKGMNQVDFDLD
jgi:hypothetical protein